MGSIDLKSQLNALIRLQEIDSQIYRLNDEKDAKPKEIEALKACLEEKKQKLADLEQASLELQKQRKEKELELAAKEEGVKKLQTQLYSLKTNKEYQAMLQQIEGTKADASVIEDSILSLFDKADKKKNEIEQERKIFQEEEKRVNAQVKGIEERVKEITGLLGQLDSQRKQIIPDIDKKILAQYERILQSRDGLAIVTVQDDACRGCNMQVPPQVVNLIKMYERIVTCEICNRILYIAGQED